jgi:hypothetical protein
VFAAATSQVVGSTRPLNGVSGLLAKIASSAQPAATLRPEKRL